MKINHVQIQKRRNGVFALTAMNQYHELFGSEFKIQLMSMLFKVQIIVFFDNSKILIMVTDTGQMNPFLAWEMTQEENAHPAICTSFTIIAQQFHPT